MAPKATPAVPGDETPSADLVLSHVFLPLKTWSIKNLVSFGTGMRHARADQARKPSPSSIYASASLQYWKHFRTSTTGSAPRYSNSMSAGISYFLPLRR